MTKLTPINQNSITTSVPFASLTIPVLMDTPDLNNNILTVEAVEVNEGAGLNWPDIRRRLSIHTGIPAGYIQGNYQRYVDEGEPHISCNWPYVIEQHFKPLWLGGQSNVMNGRIYHTMRLETLEISEKWARAKRNRP